VTFDEDCAGLNRILGYYNRSKLLQSHITTVLQLMYVHDLQIAAKISFFCTGVSKECSYCSHNSCHHTY
jgi:hypothetical protein